MTMKIKIWSSPADFGRGLDVAVMSVDERTGRDGLLKGPLTFVDVTNQFVERSDFTFPAQRPGGGVIPDGKEVLQAFLDHAWLIGLRPAGFNDTKESVAALKAHLEDMRKIAFSAVLPRPDR